MACGKTPLCNNEIGINRKLIDDKATSFYCLFCLADYLGASEQDILDKIEEFKDEGCKLFD
jgi:biotin operon repressor